jgi:hypothetical protein
METENGKWCFLPPPVAAVRPIPFFALPYLLGLLITTDFVFL